MFWVSSAVNPIPSALLLSSTPSKLSDSTSSGNPVHSHNCPATPKHQTSNALPDNCKQKGWKRLLCFISFVCREERGTGGWLGRGRGGLLVWKCLVQITHSRRALFMITRTKAETFQEPSEEDQLILRKVRDLGLHQKNIPRDLGLHQNRIHINSGQEIHVKPSYASQSTSNQKQWLQKMDRFRPGCWLVNSTFQTRSHTQHNKHCENNYTNIYFI